MSEPVQVCVDLLGGDVELQALNAVVQLLERTHYRHCDGTMPPLDANQRARIAHYLHTRYPFVEEARGE
jgi:hypothetical protein